MKAGRIFIALIIVAAIGGIGYTFSNRPKTYAGEAQTEASKQTAEITECKQRLADFHKGWSDYRKDHKGADPGSIADLVPKYIKDPSKLLCPTAARWESNKLFLGRGTVNVAGKDLPCTYGFVCFNASSARELKKLKEKASLIVCSTHEEALYRSGYHKSIPGGSITAEMRGTLISEVSGAKTLVVRRDGTVGEKDDSE